MGRAGGEWGWWGVVGWGCGGWGGQALMTQLPRVWADSFDLWLYRGSIRGPDGAAPCTAQAAALAEFTAVQARAFARAFARTRARTHTNA